MNGCTVPESYKTDQHSLSLSLAAMLQPSTSFFLRQMTIHQSSVLPPEAALRPWLEVRFVLPSLLSLLCFISERSGLGCGVSFLLFTSSLCPVPALLFPALRFALFGMIERFRKREGKEDASFQAAWRSITRSNNKEDCSLDIFIIPTPFAETEQNILRW